VCATLLIHTHPGYAKWSDFKELANILPGTVTKH